MTGNYRYAGLHKAFKTMNKEKEKEIETCLKKFRKWLQKVLA